MHAAKRAWTDHFADAFVCESVARGYGVRKFDGDAIVYEDIKCEKKYIFMFYRRFQCYLGWNQKKKYARKTITHIRFIALALVGTLGSCLNTRPSGIGTLQMYC